MRPTVTARSEAQRRVRAQCTLALVALGVAVAAMLALHVLQPALDPIERPVSFYVHGEHGWLLPLALTAFGTASIALARAVGDTQPGKARHCLTLFGLGMLLDAALSSDRWFPWEQEPTLSGVVHATTAMVAPMLLLVPMVFFARQRDTRLRNALPWFILLYIAALLGSGLSLAIGFLRDGPPPKIGLAERVLAFAAAGWACATAWQTRART